MNKLLMNGRPYVVFDAHNKEHRRAYFIFIRQSTWSRSPYQFILEPGFEDIPTQCRHRLCEYYVSKEFAPVVPIATVDKTSKLTVVKLTPKKS